MSIRLLSSSVDVTICHYHTLSFTQLSLPHLCYCICVDSLPTPSFLPSFISVFSLKILIFTLIKPCQIEVLKWLVCLFVIQDENNKITDVISFYTLPSTVMHHPVHKQLKAAYSFYNAATKTPILDLIQDGLILAKMVCQLNRSVNWSTTTDIQLETILTQMITEHTNYL